MHRVLADRFAPFGTTIFTEMSLLAQKHGAVNLAQGFPDFDGPEFMRVAAARALGVRVLGADAPAAGEAPAAGGTATGGTGEVGQNQYARMFGVPALNAAIAAGWSARTGMVVDPDRQVTVTSGCTEAICAAMLGLLNPGDEIVLFEPFYDSYRVSLAMAGATARYVTLRAPECDRGSSGRGDEKREARFGEPGYPEARFGEPGYPMRCTPLSGEGQFWFDPQELAGAFNEKTRAILVNTPHNPTGKVFTRDELGLIAELCMKHDVIAITDEVYEHLTYGDARHVHLATIPGMEERTLTLSSLGKTFSLTGWKVGWAIGSAELSAAVRAAHQFMTFSTATPLQWGAAAAAGLGTEAREAIAGLVTDLTRGREYLAGVLRGCGFEVYEPAGAYFIMADWRNARVGGGARLGERFADDVAFCRYLTSEVGVAAIPPSVFYQNKEHGRRLARFAFCKRMETLREAGKRLEAWAKGG